MVSDWRAVGHWPLWHTHPLLLWCSCHTCRHAPNCCAPLVVAQSGFAPPPKFLGLALIAAHLSCPLIPLAPGFTYEYFIYLPFWPSILFYLYNVYNFFIFLFFLFTVGFYIYWWVKTVWISFSVFQSWVKASEGWSQSTEVLWISHSCTCMSHIYLCNHDWSTELDSFPFRVSLL